MSGILNLPGLRELDKKESETEYHVKAEPAAIVAPARATSLTTSFPYMQEARTSLATCNGRPPMLPR